MARYRNRRAQQYVQKQRTRNRVPTGVKRDLKMWKWLAGILGVGVAVAIWQGMLKWTGFPKK